MTQLSESLTPIVGPPRECLPASEFSDFENTGFRSVNNGRSSAGLPYAEALFRRANGVAESADGGQSCKGTFRV